MTRVLIGAGLAALVLAGCGPDVPPPQVDAATTERHAREFVEALKPHRPGKPLIAVVAFNEATETTDFLLPHAVLKRAGVAEVQAVAPRRGRVDLYPAFDVEVAQDFADFDGAHPSGADYVIVPAMDDANDAAITGWLRRQAGLGARIISVCAGGLVLARTGLLDGRRFVTHWYFVDTLLERHPSAIYVPHQRYVVDRGIASTTGVTASIPVTLALVEAIGGREKAQALAAELGVTSWSPAHDSSLFGLNFRRAALYLRDMAMFWRHEKLSVDVRDGMDDIALALAADAWTRTGRVSVEAVSASGPVKLGSGMVLIAEHPGEGERRLPLTPALKPVQQLDRTLCEIGERYGDARREWVMTELEYAKNVVCP
jgi:putative intracellular protease/amidase